MYYNHLQREMELTRWTEGQQGDGDGLIESMEAWEHSCGDIDRCENFQCWCALPSMCLSTYVDGKSMPMLQLSNINRAFKPHIMEVHQCLAAPHCDSTHSYGFRSLIICTVSLILRLRWTESRRMTNSMVSCDINNLQFINWFISSKDGFIDNEEPLHCKIQGVGKLHLWIVVISNSFQWFFQPFVGINANKTTQMGWKI